MTKIKMSLLMTSFLFAGKMFAILTPGQEYTPPAWHEQVDSLVASMTEVSGCMTDCLDFYNRLLA